MNVLRRDGGDRLDRAASTSAQPADRSTPRLIAATTGPLSSATCRPSCRWKRRRCHDPRHHSHHLRNLAGTTEVTVEVTGPGHQRAVLDALEARYPVLRGTIREYATRGRPFLRFFCRHRRLVPPVTGRAAAPAVIQGSEPFPDHWGDCQRLGARLYGATDEPFLQSPKAIPALRPISSSTGPAGRLIFSSTRSARSS